MSSHLVTVTKRRWIRWIPAIIAPVVIVAGALAAQASTTPVLPKKSVEQVLALMAGSTVTAFSGDVQESSDLGLPSLPDGAVAGSTSGAGAASSASIMSDLALITGSHTGRIYVDGRTKVRAQDLTTMAETDVIRNGQSLWVYDSQKNTATHLTLPAAASAAPSSPGAASPGGSILSPAAEAKRVIAKLSPSSNLAVHGSVRVARRDAYDLVLTPKTSDTLVKNVSIAVDEKTGMPLKVAVNARNQKDSAVFVEFTSLTVGAPPASTFSFTPPAGATVKQQSITYPARPDHVTRGGLDAQGVHSNQTVIGKGWDAVVELPASDLPPSVTSSPLYTKATQSVTGGRLFSTSLVNVFISSDGRVYIGSVPLSRLQSVAAAS